MTESFLTELSPDELSGFRAAGRTRRFGPGEMVFREGDDAGGVMAIVSGRMKVAVAGVGGREVVLQFPGPGDLVGELSPISAGRAARASWPWAMSKSSPSRRRTFDGSSPIIRGWRC